MISAKELRTDSFYIDKKTHKKLKKFIKNTKKNLERNIIKAARNGDCYYEIIKYKYFGNDFKKINEILHNSFEWLTDDLYDNYTVYTKYEYKMIQVGSCNMMEYVTEIKISW